MSVRYGALTALGDFDFVAAERSVTAVIGPNGSGKTTFLNALTGAVPFYTGRVSVLGEAIEKATPGNMHRAGLSRTFQNLDLMDDLSVEDNVRLGEASDSKASLIEAAFALRGRSRRRGSGRRTPALRFEQLDIAALSMLSVSELSYGMRRRVEVARDSRARRRSCCWTSRPGHGSERERRVAALVLHLRDELGLTVVLIEHDMSVVRATADQVYVSPRAVTSRAPRAVVRPRRARGQAGVPRRLRGDQCLKSMICRWRTGRSRSCTASASPSPTARSSQSSVATARGRPRP